MSLNSTTLKVANNTSTWEKHILSQPKIHTIIYNSKTKQTNPPTRNTQTKPNKSGQICFHQKQDTRYINATTKQHSTLLPNLWLPALWAKFPNSFETCILWRKRTQPSGRVDVQQNNKREVFFFMVSLPHKKIIHMKFNLWLYLAKCWFLE